MVLEAKLHIDSFVPSMYHLQKHIARAAGCLLWEGFRLQSLVCSPFVRNGVFVFYAEVAF